MQIKKYLPLGSVVLLKGAKHRAMIIGFCINDQEDDNKLYDYIGCLFPEGLFTLENIMAFNHEDIGEIFYMGYSDKEEKEFKNKLVGMTQKYVNANGSLNTSVEDIFNNEMIDGQ